MTHPRSYNPTGFVIAQQYPMGSLTWRDTVPRGGRFFLLCFVRLFRVLLPQIPFTHPAPSYQAARPWRLGPRQGCRSQASPPPSCCCLFAIFLIIITSPREKAGNVKRHGTEAVNFATLGATEAGE